MIKFFWGATKNPGQMRFHTGTLMSRIADSRKIEKQFATHEILGIYGVQIGTSLFGRVSLGKWGVIIERADDERS